MPREKRPSGAGWRELTRMPALPTPTLAVSWWTDRVVVVCSALEDADYPTGQGSGPQWHVSISLVSRTEALARPGRAEVRRVLKAFALVGAEEDNHHPGRARHFWRPVDPAQRVDCECKSTETLVTEGDGYRWTNPNDGPCRGCEIARLTNVPCSLHAEVSHG